MAGNYNKKKHWIFKKVSSELLSSHPGSAEGLTVKGLAHRATNEYQQAEQWYVFFGFFSSIHKFTHTHLCTYLLFCSFTEALSQRPDSGELYFLLGQLYWNMGDDTRRDRGKVHTHLLKVMSLDLCPVCTGTLDVCLECIRLHVNSLTIKECSRFSRPSKCST